MSEKTEICGIICIHKPQGYTSFDVIARLRGILKMKRLGHGGTLDPMAEGVLPVFAGRATTACDILPDTDKEYIGGFRLGISTDTQDITGNIISEKGYSPINRSDIENVLKEFRGEIMQLPPMYSAVSVNGKRLYELARQNITVERTPRPVTIYSLELVSFDEDSGEGTLKIACSSGTYIRTLINDIGEKLGTGGTMTSLVRTRACGFSLSDCVTLETLEESIRSGSGAERYVYPIERVFEDLPEVCLVPFEEKLYRNGVKLDRKRLCLGEKTGRVRISGSGGFIGTAEISGNGEITVGKTFVLPESGTVNINENGCAAALGIFDGVHRGHKAVISAAVEEAKKFGGLPAVFTFRTETVSTKSAAGNCIITEREKERRLKAAGIGFICVCDFDDIKNMSPENFVKRILIRRMNAKAVVCGRDFHFGKGGTADANTLREICSRYGITVTTVSPVYETAGEKISSARIRSLISDGNVSEVHSLTDEYFMIGGYVVRGNMIGRTWGFPTANLIYPKEMKKVPFGVYASETEIDGKIYRSITDIGVKPTVQESGVVLCETNIFDFNENIYGKYIRVSLTDFIRGEMKFHNADELKEQIAKDADFARHNCGAEQT